jgi:hypothetical protein
MNLRLKTATVVSVGLLMHGMQTVRIWPFVGV